MADQFYKNPEKEVETRETAEKRETEKRGKEIENASKEFVEGVSEVVEGAETAELGEGQVGERLKEGKRRSAQGLKTGSPTAAAAKEPPTIEIMRIQVATQVKKEIRILEKEAARMLRNPMSFNASKLNGVVSKIRELKEILANLAYATAETMKGWWMKFVRGITI